MKAYMEHINITVNDLDKTVQFLQTAFPDFKVRGGGDTGVRRWAHVGTDHTYVAINQGVAHAEKNYNSTGFNHVGFVVDDVNGLADRLLSAGYERSYPKQNQQFRIRDYFLDAEGNEYEFVQYLSDNPAERNTYND